MALRSIRVSDLSGAEGEEGDFITLVVRKHPDIEEPVQLDVLQVEVKNLKTVKNLVEIELRNGDIQRVVMTVEEFNKLAHDMQDVLKNADGLRGRRKGFIPNTKPKE